MKIISAQYILAIGSSASNTVKVIAEEGTFFVPMSDGNFEYRELQKWVAEGNTIEPADE